MPVVTDDARKETPERSPMDQVVATRSVNVSGAPSVSAGMGLVGGEGTLTVATSGRPSMTNTAGTATSGAPVAWSIF